MSAVPPTVRQGAIQKLLSKLNLRFPTLFAVLAVVTVVDFFVPDLIPFADEIVLTLLTTLFGLWKNRRPVRPAEVVPPPPALEARRPGEKP